MHPFYLSHLKVTTLQRSRRFHATRVILVREVCRDVPRPPARTAGLPTANGPKSAPSPLNLLRLGLTPTSDSNPSLSLNLGRWPDCQPQNTKPVATYATSTFNPTNVAFGREFLQQLTVFTSGLLSSCCSIRLSAPCFVPNTSCLLFQFFFNLDRLHTPIKSLPAQEKKRLPKAWQFYRQEQYSICILALAGLVSVWKRLSLSLLSFFFCLEPDEILHARAHKVITKWLPVLRRFATDILASPLFHCLVPMRVGRTHRN